MSSGSEELLIKGTVHGNIAGITRKDVSSCSFSCVFVRDSL